MDHFRENEKHVSPQSLFARLIGGEVELGIASAADPVNAYRPDGALRETTVYSPWFARTCRKCKDKFRIGDQVRLCPSCGEAYHDDTQYNLHCWQKQFAAGAICNEGGFDDFSGQRRIIRRCEFSWSVKLPGDLPLPSLSSEGENPRVSPDPQLVQQFVSGVEMMWRPFGELQSSKILPGSPYVGRRCPWCRFRIRAGDWAVACPCDKHCGTYFHQDVFHRLTCWNEWNGRTGHDYCPNTFAPYPASLRDLQNDI